MCGFPAKKACELPCFLLLFNYLRTDGDFCHKGPDTEIAQRKLRYSKPIDMTIHWKGLEEHFLMVPLVFRFNHVQGEKNYFLIFFSQKNSVLKAYVTMNDQDIKVILTSVMK
jgi:hypothetical protein